MLFASLGTSAPKFVAPMNAVEPIQNRQKTAYEQLPRRYRRFVDQWVSGKCGEDAIRAAGYKKQYAHQTAYKLRRIPEVQSAIAEREAEAVQEAGVRHVRVLTELHWLATCDPRKLVNGEGVQIPLHQLPEDIAACISSVEIENISYKDETGTRYKYKFWDKNKALDKLGQYLKLWDGNRTHVNVDARSVTVNNGAGEGVLRALDDLLARAASVGITSKNPQADSNGPVLPDSVRDGQTGRGSPVDVSPHPGSAGQS